MAGLLWTMMERRKREWMLRLDLLGQLLRRSR